MKPILNSWTKGYLWNIAILEIASSAYLHGVWCLVSGVWCLGTMKFGKQASPVDVSDLISGKPGTPLDPRNGKLDT